MGAGFGQVIATAGVSVRCTDRDPSKLEEAARLVARGRYGWDAAVVRRVDRLG